MAEKLTALNEEDRLFRACLDRVQEGEHYTLSDEGMLIKGSSLPSGNK